MKKFLLAFTCFALFSLTSFAAENPWVGNWKLDVSKSHFTGDTFSYSKAANGMMHYSDGSTISFDFGVDGKEYKSEFDRTTAWTGHGENAWDTVTKAKGITLYQSHYQISPDSKTLTIQTTGTKPDGSTFNDEAIYTRVTGTTGPVGKWRSTKVTISAPDAFHISSPSPGVLHWDIPSYKESVEGKPDGSDLTVTGPTVPPSLTIAFKSVSPTKMSYVLKDNGKPIGYGTQTLTAGGKSYTDVSWNPGKENEKQTGFYTKE
jgi:hypothetical protein